MDRLRRGAVAFAVFAAAGVLAAGELAAAGNEAAVIAEATSGQFKSTKGQYFDKECNQQTDYEAEVIDLNSDGQPEVFTQIFGTCLGGAAGVSMNLYIKGADGRWHPQFGFPGVYQVLATRNKGYPDIEIGGPGSCFPIWRWNGKEYALFKKCPR